MTAREEKRSAGIEQEIEQTRTRMDETLGAIQEKLSPGQLVDQVLAYSKGGPGQYFSNLGRTAQQNPVPVALLGVGLAWLMMSSSKTGDRDYAAEADYAEEEYDTDEDYDSDYGLFEYEEKGALSSGREAGVVGGYTGLEDEMLGEEYLRERDPSPAGLYVATRGEEDEPGEVEESRKERAKESAARMKAKVGEAADRASERAGEAAGVAQARARRAARAARRGGRRLGYKGRRQVSQASRGVQHFLREQPLVLGALGIAVGAALGAGLPATRREDALMGDARDDLIRRGRQAGREQIEKGQRMAGAARDAAMQEATEQGLTPEAAEAQVREAKEKVEKVATSARAAAEEEAKR